MAHGILNLPGTVIPVSWLGSCDDAQRLGCAIGSASEGTDVPIQTQETGNGKKTTIMTLIDSDIYRVRLFKLSYKTDDCRVSLYLDFRDAPAFT